MEEEILAKLKYKQIGETIEKRIQSDPVLVHEFAEVPHSPVSPNVPLCLVLGSLAGAIVGPILAFLLTWVITRIQPER